MDGIRRAPWFSPVLSLRWRLVFVYIGLFGVFVTILSFFLYSSVSHALLNNAKEALPQHARDLRTLLIQEVCASVSAQIPSNFVQAGTGTDVEEVFLLDQSGMVLASSNNALLNHPFPYLDPSLFQAKTPVMPQYFQKAPGGQVISDGYILPIPNQPQCRSSTALPKYIVVLTAYSGEEDSLQRLLFTLGIVSAVMLIAGAVIIALVTGIMLSPLNQVTQVAQELAEGNLQKRVQVPPGRNEVSLLAENFNQMADRIEQMFAIQQASERRARRFVSDASHELRTPITSLRGFTEVLLRGAKDDPATTQRILGLMKNEAERMTELVNDLLTLARLDEGQLPEASKIDFVDITVGAIQKARKLAPEDCKLSLELISQERLTIMANPEPITQMILALLKNGLRYGCTQGPKVVHVRLDKKADHVLLQVIDHGQGISANDLPHIFDRFYRGENVYSTKAPVPGTGLGLPIAQSIAQAYKGIITACSEPEQETIFTISFPSE